jgi:hypothetical protein
MIGAPLTLPDGFDGDTLPAHIIYNRAHTAAYVFHPLGVTHPVAQAAISRLRARNVRVLNSPEHREELL